MKKILLIIIVAIFFTNNIYAKAYKTGDTVIDEFVVNKKYKVSVPGEWKVIYRRSDSWYGFIYNFYALTKVENNELLEYTGILEYKLAGQWVGGVDNFLNEIIFKDKYDGCYERPEYYLTEVFTVGSAHNCFQVAHIDLYREMYTPDDPYYGRASVARFKNWIEDNNIKYSKIMLASTHSYFSRMVDGNWVSVTRIADPKIYNAPKSKHLSEETSEYHKHNIDNFPEHKKMMEKWISISAQYHIEFENNARAKGKHRLDLNKYITYKNLENTNSSFVEQIKKLNDLYKSGVLTEEEFKKAKDKILNN